ncbi:hypothetical protein LG329_04375 [Virgibacillus necropolis]|uniref:hypothetical protein n=1 Tax=Virgibacillus necropolis TaxID=163877 RepID=UPI003850B23F
MMEFLYFPEDKSEYIPALITLLIFMIGAAITMYFFYKHSKKEAKRIDEKYNLNQDTENYSDDNKSE